MLLETKLHAPPARTEWGQRAELVARLAGANAKLVLVAAPAGFGKTTLVAQWQLSPAESRPFAWISLDPAATIPAWFWWHVAHALQRLPGVQRRSVLALVRGQPPDFAETLLPLLINELAKLTEPVLLVLDDYHVISEPDCHDQLAFLLLHLPPTVGLVLLTRADPPLPLARVRAAGELTEVGRTSRVRARACGSARRRGRRP